MFIFDDEEESYDSQSSIHQIASPISLDPIKRYAMQRLEVCMFQCSNYFGHLMPLDNMRDARRARKEE